ncbi:hypothetical protein MGI18_23160 [Bacillus sp. OVS6]|nr:hypothetical protein MGI18_23160 [Bacillus sp. OVS6]
MMDPVKVNVEFVEYEYFAHGYQEKLRYWQYALAQHVNNRMKMYFYKNKNLLHLEKVRYKNVNKGHVDNAIALQITNALVYYG